MRVLLVEDVDNLGYAGEVHKVANGYGRNFLLPRGFAVKASPGQLKQAERWRTRAETRRDEIRAKHDALSQKVVGVVLNFTARAGDNGRLYGSVTSQQITEKLNAELGTSIDRRKVDTPGLRELGEYQIVVRLDRDHTPQFIVNVHPEMVEADEEEVEPADSEDREEYDDLLGDLDGDSLLDDFDDFENY